jgi:hypothetical protein
MILLGSNHAYAYQFQDHFKTVINQIPHTVEVCTKGNGKSDLDNFLTGAIIGGAIGNNIKGEENGGAIGGILGGIVNTERNKGNQCRTETRYTEEQQLVYSHTTVTFTYEGRQYTLSFNK